MLTHWFGRQPLPLWQKAAAGLTAGGLGALVGSPADLTLIRMQADGTLPAEQRQNYKGVGDAFARCVGAAVGVRVDDWWAEGERGAKLPPPRTRVRQVLCAMQAHSSISEPSTPTLHRTVKQDGVAGLFRGAGPTVVRAMALNMGMLASNDQVSGAGWLAGWCMRE